MSPNMALSSARAYREKGGVLGHEASSVPIYSFPLDVIHNIGQTCDKLGRGRADVVQYGQIGRGHTSGT